MSRVELEGGGNAILRCHGGQLSRFGFTLCFCSFGFVEGCSEKPLVGGGLGCESGSRLE